MAKIASQEIRDRGEQDQCRERLDAVLGLWKGQRHTICQLIIAATASLTIERVTLVKKIAAFWVGAWKREAKEATKSYELDYI